MNSTSIISIDRSKPFNLFEFMVKNKQTSSGDELVRMLSSLDTQNLRKLKIVTEDDKRSLSIKELDVNKINLVSYINKGKELSVTGEGGFKRVKQTNKILLDVKFFEYFIENPEKIPEDWKTSDEIKKKNPEHIKYVYFDGTVFKFPFYPSRVNMCICFYQNRWRWLINLMVKQNGYLDFSAVTG